MAYTYDDFLSAAGSSGLLGEFSQTDLDRGPTTNMFANRSFLAKYLTSYYGSEVSDGKIVSYVKTLGSRDLGLSMSYRFKTDVPLNLIAGVFNGSGTNNPEWGKRVNLMGRIELGGDKGLQGSVAYYHGYSPQHVKVEEQNGTFVTEDFEQKLRMVGGELRYTRGGLLLEGEYARRYLCMEGATAMMATALVQGYYRFQLPKCPTMVTSTNPNKGTVMFDTIEGRAMDSICLSRGFSFMPQSYAFSATTARKGDTCLPVSRE